MAKREEPNSWAEYKKRTREQTSAASGQSVSGNSTAKYGSWAEYKAARQNGEVSKGVQPSPFLDLETYKNNETQPQTNPSSTPRVGGGQYAVGSVPLAELPVEGLRVGGTQAAQRPPLFDFGTYKNVETQPKTNPSSTPRVRKEETQPTQPSPFLDLETYISRMEAEQEKERKRQERPSYAEELFRKYGNKVINAELPEVSAPQSRASQLSAELGLPDFNQPREQLRLERDPYSTYVSGGLPTGQVLTERAGITPEMARAEQKPLHVGAGEVARKDPALVDYAALKAGDPSYIQWRDIGAQMSGNPVMAANEDRAYTRLDAVSSHSMDAQKKMKYTYMTPEEIDTYNYLLGKEGQYGEKYAQYYLSTLEDTLNQRQGMEFAQNIYSENVPAYMRELTEFGASVTDAFQQHIQGLKDLPGALRKDETPSTPSANSYARAAMYERNGMPGRIAMDLGSGIGQNMPQILASVMLPGAPAWLMRVLNLGTMSASMFGTTYNERLREGRTPDEAARSAVGASVLEAALEAIGGPAVISGGTLTEKVVRRITDGIGNGIWRFAARTGFDMLGEGTEEFLSGTLGNLLQNALLDGKAGDINWGEVAYETLIGGLSGGLLGLPGNVNQTIGEYQLEKQHKAIKGAAESIKSAETTQEQKHNAAAAALEAGGVEKEAAQEIAGSVVRMANGQTVSQDELLRIAQTPGALETVETIVGANAEFNVDSYDDIEVPEGVENVEAYQNRERAVRNAMRLGSERAISEEIYDMGNGQDAAQYTAEYERAYNRGRNNLPMTDEIAGSYKTLTAEQTRAAWNEGSKAYRAAQQGKGVQAAKSMNGRKGYIDTSAIRDMRMTAAQRSAVRASRFIAEALGVKVVWYASEANAEGKRTDANGYFDPKDGSIHLDVYAGVNTAENAGAYRYAAMRTFSHELTHFIEYKSPALYSKLRDMVFSHLAGKGIDVEQLIDEKAARTPGISRYEATQEVVADACEMMLRDSNAVRQAAMRDAPLWEKIRERFDRFVADLRAAFERVEAVHREAEGLMEDFGGVLRYVEDLQKAWDEGLLDATSNARRAGEDSIVLSAEAEQDNETAEQNNSEADQTGSVANQNEPETEQTAEETEQTAEETEQTAEETEQTAEETEQDVEQREPENVGPQKREGVTLMEDRSWDSIKDRSMRPFAEEVPEVREWFSLAAELLQEDLAASTKGEKIYTPNAPNEPGTLHVTGIKRHTVAEIADLLDRGMTYINIGSALDAYAQMDMEWIRKHPQTAKKVELSLDQILTDGYTNIEGERLQGIEEYRNLMDELAGREPNKPVEYDLGEEMRFSSRDTSLDLSDRTEMDGDVRYQPREEEYVSNREILANALEGTARSIAEKNRLAEYRMRIRSLDIAQNRVSNIREEITEVNRMIKEAKGAEKKQLTERLENLQAQKNTLEREMNETDKVLLKLEATEPLKLVVNRERKAAMDKVRAKADDSRNRDKYRQRVAQKVAALTVQLTKPTTKKYIPDPIRGPVADFLSSVRFTSKRQLQGGAPTQKDMKLAESLAALQRVMLDVQMKQNGNTADAVQNGFGMYLDLPDGFIKTLTALSDQVAKAAQHSEEGYNVNMMSTAQLKALDAIITSLNESIKNVNRFLSENLYRHIDDAARDTIWDLEQLKSREKSTKIGKFLEWDNALPIYAFDRLGRGGRAIFKGLMRGQAKLAQNTDQVIKYAESVYDENELKLWEEDVRVFRFGEETIRMPVTHIMSLYCHMKREQSMGHLLGEGFRVGDYTKKGVTYKDEGHVTSRQMMEEIVSELSDRQKEVADKLQNYMSTVGAEWGNYVSMRRFGYEAFGEKNYFPIESDSRHLSAVSEDGGKGNPLYALLNIGPVRELTPKANNRLVLHSIFDVYSKHMSEMAQYNALALPLLDAIKWLNYRETANLPGDEKTTKRTKSIQDVIVNAYGMQGRGYVIRMLEDISGKKATVDEDKTFSRMLGRMNRAQVASNLRVALLQPLSIFRAAMTLDAVPMMWGVLKNIRNLQDNIEEMEQYSGIAKWKAMGFREVNVSRGVQKLIKHDYKTTDKIVEKSMMAAEAMDKLTWSAIWEVCKLKTAKEISPDSEGYMEAVRDLFEETIYRTQVVDSVLTKTQYMRSPSGMNKWLSSFMSEPSTTYNMLADAVWKVADDARVSNVQDALRKNAPNIGRTVGVYAVSAIFTTLLEGIMSAWRDDDDYEKFTEQMFDGFWWNLFENMNPIAMLPVGSQLWEGAKTVLENRGVDVYGYDMSNPINETFQSMIGIFDAWDRYSKGSGTGYSVLYKSAQMLSTLTGLPFANTTREVTSVWNNGIASWNPQLRVQTYKTPDAKGAAAYIEAVRNNNDRLADEMLEELDANGVTGDAREKAMKDAIRDAYMGGGMDEKEAVRMLETYAGYADTRDDKQAAERLVREWDVKGETGENSQYARIWSHISDWDGSALRKEIAELRRLGVKDGSMRSSVQGHFKDIYLEASGTEKSLLRQHLIAAFTYMGMSSADAKEKVNGWDREARK